MTIQMTAQEGNTRVRMLNSFMTCPHRDTDRISAIHKELQESDPVFYGHLASWYVKPGNGTIRDHIEIFAAFLTVDKYIENREVGLAMWREQPPFMKHKIIGYIEGKTIRIREKTGKKIKSDKGKMVPEIKITEKFVGFGRGLPTSFRKERENYLRWLESKPELFDAIAIRNFKDLKGLYAAGRNGVKMSERAHRILWDRDYPEDCKLSVYQKIIKAASPEEQAKLIVENKIPFAVAVSLVESITPSVMVALINAMTPQEVINNTASLESKGALDNPEVKKLIEDKLDKAMTSNKVATLKSKTASATGRIKDESILQKLDQVADKQVRKAGTINMGTAVVVDKSGSMKLSIEVGKRAAAMVSGAMGDKAKLYVLVHDNDARQLTAAEPTLTAWEKAFEPADADNGTSMGSVLDYLIHINAKVDQLIFFTDEGEQSAPYLHDVFPKYVAKFGIVPRIVLVTLPNEVGQITHILSGFLRAHQIDFETYVPENSDYYGLPGLLMMLSRNTKLDIIYEILETPLLKRKAYQERVQQSKKKAKAKVSE